MNREMPTEKERKSSHGEDDERDARNEPDERATRDASAERNELDERASRDRDLGGERGSRPSGESPTARSPTRISLWKAAPAGLGLLTLLIFVVAFATFRKSERVLKGVSLLGRDLSELGARELDRVLVELAASWSKRSALVACRSGERFERALRAADVGLSLDVSSARAAALAAGRSGELAGAF